MLMEKYMRAARTIAGDAMDISIPDHADVEISAKKFYNNKGSTEERDGVRWFKKAAEVATKFNAPASGAYEVTLQVSATEAGGEILLTSYEGLEDTAPSAAMNADRESVVVWES